LGLKEQGERDNIFETGCLAKSNNEGVKIFGAGKTRERGQ